MRVQAIPATILAMTTENALTDMTTLATMVGGACTERRNKSIFHFQRKLYVQLSLNACTFRQGHCDEYGCAVIRHSGITTAGGKADMVVEQSRKAEVSASNEIVFDSRRAVWRFIARTERTKTSETWTGEGKVGDAEEFHAGTLDDGTSPGIHKIKGDGDVFDGRVEHGIVMPGECAGDNVDIHNIKCLDKDIVALSGDVKLYKKVRTEDLTNEEYASFYTSVGFE